MRQRLRPFRDRAMARRPGDDDSLPLSPRARRIGGWIAAALLIGGIALAFRILGGNGDGTVVDSSPSGSTGSSAQGITFGTALDPATGEVAADARTERFAEGDTFVYSVAPSGSGPPPDRVYVEVERRAVARPKWSRRRPTASRLPNPQVIAFTVPAVRSSGRLRTGHVPDAHLRRSGGRPARGGIVRAHRPAREPQRHVGTRKGPETCPISDPDLASRRAHPTRLCAEYGPPTAPVNTQLTESASLVSS